jgi:hypothetical protein
MLFRISGLAALTAATLHCALVRVEVKERAPVPGTAYERMIGRAYFTVARSLPVNRALVDLDKAPRNAAGQVEFSSDLYVLKPKAEAANGAILFEVSNRGGRGMLSMFDRASASKELGDRFLLDRGYTLVWLGWQFDVPEHGNLLRLYAPVAHGVTGLVRAEIVVDHKTNRQSVADRNHQPYPVDRPDDAALKLTVRDRVEGPRQTLPRAAWHIDNGVDVVLDAGFEPGRLYELVYPAKDPPVAGLGMAAIRDLISAMKYGHEYGDLKRAIAYGASQSGRFLRTYLYDGFNQDEQNRKVFDGVLAHVAGAGRGSFNVPFAQPSRDGHPSSTRCIRPTCSHSPTWTKPIPQPATTTAC